MSRVLNFSERNGYKMVSDVLQVETMSYELRNSLFNAIVIHIINTFFDEARFTKSTTQSIYQALNSWGYYAKLDVFFRKFYCQILKQKITEIPDREEAWEVFERYFDKAEWHEVYSLLEWFVSQVLTQENAPSLFVEYVNMVLEENLSGYRFVDGLIVQIVDNKEISEISEALSHKQEEIGKQISSALQSMHDKNYRHSVKESISAVETFARSKTGTSDMGAALSELEKFAVPKPIKQAFDKIYGWTCGPDGVRHALMNNAQDVTFAEAKFMLIVCSAFVNYLTVKMN